MQLIINIALSRLKNHLGSGGSRVVSRARLFGLGSGLKLTKISDLIRARDIFFALGAQKYNQNNLARLLNFSDPA